MPYDKDRYERKKAEINEKRRLRYEADPAYAEAQRKRSHEAYLRNKESGKPRVRKSRAKADKEASASRRRQAVRQRSMTIVVGGIERELMMFTLGYLAEQLGHSIPGLRLWESKNILPPALYRDKANRRLYTHAQVAEIKRAYDEHYTKGQRMADSPFHQRLQEIWREMPQGVPAD